MFYTYYNMASPNAKYRSLDDILNALKDEDQADDAPADDSLPKKFPQSASGEDVKPHRPSADEIAEIADDLDKEDDEPTSAKSKAEKSDDGDTADDQPVSVKKSTDTESDDLDDIEDDEAQEADLEEDEDIDDQPETVKPSVTHASAWRTSPSNPKTKSPAAKPVSDPDDDEEGASLPESLRDERPNFDVPAPKAEDRWAKFPEYPVNQSEPETHQTEPESYESNLSDIATQSEEPLEETAASPIRRIDHSSHNRFGAARTGGVNHFSDEESFIPSNTRGRSSFDYNLSDGGKNRKWQYLIIGLVALIVIAAIVFLLKNQYIPFVGSPSNIVISSPSPSPSPTPSPTPTPTPEPDRSQFKLRVLNGTTTSGLAASLADKLKGLGYQVDKTGNNSNQSVAQTQIRVKPGNASLSAELIKDLTGTYDATIGADLKPTDTVDGEVVIGAK